jgi:hypothetical protein
LVDRFFFWFFSRFFFNLVWSGFTFLGSAGPVQFLVLITLDLTAGFASVTKGATSEEDWSAAALGPLQETKLLPVWETEVHPNDGRLDTSLAKRECLFL